MVCGCFSSRKAIDLSSAEPGTVIKLFEGKDFGYWKPLLKAPFEIPGLVEIKDGVVSIAPGNSFSGLSWEGDFPLNNYEFSVSARRVSGSDIFCGIAFPSGTNYCSMILGGWGNSVVGLSCVGYAVAAENETASYMQFENKKWYNIRLRVTDEYIKGWIDGKLVIDLELSEKHISQYPGLEIFEPFGLFTWETGAEVKDMCFIRLNAMQVER